ncbi:hypothetical protein [Lentzea sp. NPDC059081]|uniref:hypothetical protein n=1 Tax=Lentzea sp. NPDC059081 TaxID=3346719 RepID=UPI0036819700
MKTLLVIVAVVAVVGGGTVVLVNSMGGWSTLIGKAWAITYEVSAQPAETSADLSYAESPDRDRYERPRTVTTTNPVPWQVEVVINAGEKAQVTATPRGDQALTCRILLDGVKELTSATAGPGQQVGCEVVTNR